ncbi:MAG: hypothetical protein GXO56_05970 [Chloroflexi bacterium]|nr:hypothetical protein [Chloroflexota bacterium]
MRIGMLWLDTSTQDDLATKVRRAAAYYRRKYGHPPTVCYVHPSMLPGEAQTSADTQGVLQVDAIEVRPLHDILPQHLWLGHREPSARAPQ